MVFSVVEFDFANTATKTIDGKSIGEVLMTYGAQIATGLSILVEAIERLPTPEDDICRRYMSRTGSAASRGLCHFKDYN